MRLTLLLNILGLMKLNLFTKNLTNMIHKIFAHLAFFCLTFSLNFADSDDFFIRRCRPQAGLFSTFLDIMSGLESYEKGLCSGFQVDFAKTGLYYDRTVGPNWWNYYFKPLHVGKNKGTIPIVLESEHELFWPTNTEYHMTRQRAKELIDKYIHIKPSILKIVEEKLDKVADYYLIGVHYRGTDKKTEVPLVSYEDVLEEVNKHYKKNCQIYVATDDQNFLDLIHMRFHGRVRYLKEATRSLDGKPTHLHPMSPYLEGKNAIIDCLMLSKCNVLIRTSSNLSLVSTFFNPFLKVVEIKK